MKKKIILDIFLFIIMILLMNYSFTGGLLHEILGIAIFLLFIIHNKNNIIWIKKVTKNILKGDFNRKLIINYIVDIILWISLIVVTISGIFISKDLLTFITFNSTFNWYQLHVVSAYVLLSFIVIHVLLHMKMVANFIERTYKIENKTSFRFISLFIVFSLFALGYKNFFVKNLVNEKTNSSTNYSSDSTVNDDDMESSMNSNSTSDDESYNNSNSDSDSSSYNSTDNTSDKPTLAQYLSQLHCTNCGRHCPLSAISCSRGNQPKTEATSEYYSTYGE